MHAVIFDIDGTLVQSAKIDDELYQQSTRAVLGPVEFRPNLSDYDFVTDSGILSQLLKDNGLPELPDPTAAIRTHFVDALENHISDNGPFVEVHGASELLGALRMSRNHSVAIATGGWRESAVLKLRSAAFDVEGIPIATSDTEYDRSRIMLSALSSLGRDFDSVTYYGDGPWDRDACIKLNWQFVPVGPALGGLDSFSEIGVA